MARPRPTSDRGLIQQVTAFVGVSALAGVLVAGLLIPLAGGIGLGARSAAESFEELPADIETPPLPQRTRVLDAEGKLLATFYTENRVIVPLDKMAPVMRDAILAIEDSRFYEHGGLDLRGAIRALITNTQSGDVRQGGSTLTQQYVKNLLIEQARGNPELIEEAREESIARKVRELKYAIALEERLSKDQILENYLNIAYFGGGAYGVEAAAQRFFSKSAAKLTLPEAALLAGVVRSPSAYDPLRDLERATERRDLVLDRMATEGMITSAKAAEAKQAEVALKPKEFPNGCATSRSYAPFFCAYVEKLVLTDEIFGKTPEDREALWRRGGLTIKTTIHPDMQKAAQEAVDDYVDPEDDVASALAMVEPGTGHIRAMAQSDRYGKGDGELYINLAVDKAMGGGSGFQTGSSFKPFTAAAALEKGVADARTRIRSPYQLDTSDFRDEDCEGKPVYGWDEDDQPRNWSRSHNRRFTMIEAMARSVNTYFIQLLERTGVCETARLGARLGLRRGTGDPLRQEFAMTLGTNEITPLRMAEAYATFAARGVHCTPIAITGITDRDGNELEVPKPDCERVLDPRVADTVNKLLVGVIERSDGTGRALRIGRPAGGKTGTTQNTKNVWFIGYTPNLAAAVWAGHPTPPENFTLNDKTIGGEHYASVSSGRLPGRIWRDAMREAVDKLPRENFREPPDRLYPPAQRDRDDDDDRDRPPRPPRQTEPPEPPEPPEWPPRCPPNCVPETTWPPPPDQDG